MLPAMRERALSAAWLSSWLNRICGVLDSVTEGFERRHGFPPGTNHVRAADHDDRKAAEELAQVDLAAADLVTFYENVGEAVWEDVGNGCFVAPAREVLRLLAEHGAVGIGANEEPGGLVMGSNGGGLSYVIDPGGAVHRTRTASLDAPELDRVAEDLRQFLELLEDSLARFVATGVAGRP